MENKQPSLQVIIINVGQRYVQEDDRKIRKYIGRILEGVEKNPYKSPQRRKEEIIKDGKGRSKMIIRDYKVGEKVKVVHERGNFIKNDNPTKQEVPSGWEGTIISIGTTEDGIYYSYDLMSEDGTIIKDYPSPCLMKVIPGTERDVIKIINEMGFIIMDDVEKAEFQTVRDYIASTEKTITMMLHTMYLYGKTVGTRQERQKKKAHPTEVR